MNVRMIDAIMRHQSHPRVFGKREIKTIMELERISPKVKKGGRLDVEATELANQLKNNFELSQALLNRVSDVERVQELLRAVVVHRIEKELEQYKRMPTLKDRQKHLDSIINEYISNFDSLRKYFTNPKQDSFVEKKLMSLVTKESLEDIEKEKSKRESLEIIRKEMVSKHYESIRNDISSRETMLEAFQVLEKMIIDSKTKITRYTNDKIEWSKAIKDFQQEVASFCNLVRYENLKQGQSILDT